MIYGDEPDYVLPFLAGMVVGGGAVLVGLLLTVPPAKGAEFEDLSCPAAGPDMCLPYSHELHTPTQESVDLTHFNLMCDYIQGMPEDELEEFGSDPWGADFLYTCSQVDLLDNLIIEVEGDDI